MELTSRGVEPLYLKVGSREMDAVHALQLELLLLVDGLCRSHNIPYYLIFGSLLGAVRHGGFIPWDDDIDIGLLQSDYKKLADLLETELDSDRYFFQTAANDGGISIPYAKVRCRHTCFAEWYTPEHVAWEQGVFLDIFPLYDIPDEPARARSMRRSFLKNHMALRYKLEGYRSDKWLYNLAYWFFARSSVPTLLLKRDRALNRWADPDARMLLAPPASPSDYDNSFLNKAELAPPEDLSFCGHTVMVPRQAKLQLEYLFGDYMSLPPKQDRRGHALRYFYIDEDFWAPVLSQRLTEVR